MHTAALFALLLAASGGQCPPAWNYEHQNEWGGLCATGKSQSPVVIAHTSPKNLPPLGFAYKPFSAAVLNTSRTTEVEIPHGVVERMQQGSAAYELLQFHFHFPAEHRDGDRAHAGELHLVHRDAATGRYHVVAIWIDSGEENAALDPIVRLATNLAGCHTSTEEAIVDPAMFLPKAASYETYGGSLTTPPCTEGVTFIILEKTIQASAAQIAVLSRGQANARAIQRSVTVRKRAE